MIASKVLSEEDLQAAIQAEGFVKTREKTDTGCFWRNEETGKHIFVPDSIDGFYPRWLLQDLQDHIGRLPSIW